MSGLLGIIKGLNSSKFLAAIAMLILNVGTKYLAIDISKSQEEILKHVLFRRFALFTLFFVATKDVVFSLVLTALFIIFVGNLFNENSKYCLYKNKRKNKQVKISEQDYIKSLKIKALFEKQIANEIR